MGRTKASYLVSHLLLCVFFVYISVAILFQSVHDLFLFYLHAILNHVFEKFFEKVDLFPLKYSGFTSICRCNYKWVGIAILDGVNTFLGVFQTFTISSFLESIWLSHFIKQFVTMFVGKFYNCVTNHQAHRPRPFVRDYLSREAILTRKLGVQSQTRLCRTRLKLFGPLHRCDLFLRSFPLIFQRSELWLLEDESQIMFHKTEFESRSSRTFFPFDRCYQSDAAWRCQIWHLYILVFEKWFFYFDRSNMQIFTVNITLVVWPHVTNILNLR